MSKNLFEQRIVHCTDNCPFLEINYFEAMEKIPYHCALYDTFLGFDGKVLRCSECLGQQRNIKEEGLNFINAFYAQNLNKSATKAGFAKLLPNLQHQFVAFLKKFGKPVALSNNIDISDLNKLQNDLSTKLALTMRQVKHDKNIDEVMRLLNNKPDDGAPEDLTSGASKMILNLLAVMDLSEREMLLQILKNPYTFKQFLQKIKLMPKDANFLSSARIVLENMYPESSIVHSSQSNIVAKIKTDQQRTKD